MPVREFRGALDEAPVAEPFSGDTDEERAKSPSVLDYAKQALQGYVGDTARMIGYGLESAGIDYGRRMRESGDWLEQELLQSMTPGGRRAATTPVFTGEGISDIGVTDKWGQSLVMGTARSAPSMVMMAPVGGPVAAGVSKVIPAAAKAAPGLTGLLARNAPGGLGFGLAEGLQAGALNAAQLKSEIETADPAQLARTSPRFRELLAENDPQTAQRILADEAAAQAFRTTAPWTGAVSALTGGGALGELVKPGARNIVKGFARGALSEAAQEAPQSGGEQYFLESARRDFVDESIDPRKGVPQATLEGGAVGGLTGGVFGGAAHIGRPGGEAEEETTDTVRKMRELKKQMQEETARQTAERTAQDVKARAEAVGAKPKEKPSDATIVSTPADAAGAQPAPAEAQVAEPAAPPTTETGVLRKGRKKNKATAKIAQEHAALYEGAMTGVGDEVERLAAERKALSTIAAELEPKFGPMLNAFNASRKDQAPTRMADVVNAVYGARAIPQGGADFETWNAKRIAARAAEKTVDLTGMGTAIADNLYETLFKALQAGSDTAAGVKDPVLAKAKPFYERGEIKSAADLKALVARDYAPAETIDADAHEAAASPENERPDPTKPQIEANNAKLGHPKVDGMDVSIESPAGSTREDKKNDPPRWRVQLEDHYGYIRGTEGFDKDHLDVFVKKGMPKEWTGTYYVVNQNREDGEFDEHKVMAGYDTPEEARAAYVANYDDAAKAEKRIRSIVPLASPEFKAWAFDKTEKGPRGGELPKVGTIVPETGTEAVETPQAEPKAEAAEETTPPISEPEVKKSTGLESLSNIELDKLAVEGTRAERELAAQERERRRQPTAEELADGKRALDILTGKTKQKRAPTKDELTFLETPVGGNIVRRALRDPRAIKDLEEMAAEKGAQFDPTSDHSIGYGKGWAAAEMGVTGEQQTAEFMERIPPKQRGGFTDGYTAYDAITNPQAEEDAEVETETETKTEQAAETESDTEAEKETTAAEAEEPAVEEPAAEEEAAEEPEATAEQEPRKKRAPKAKEPTGDTQREKMQDAGEKMYGKRADMVTKSLRDEATGNRKKDLQKILDRVSKSGVWPITLPEGATSGTRVYLERVRDNISSFLEFAGRKAGGGRSDWMDNFSEALLKYVERGTEQREEIEKEAGKYIALLEQLRDATKDAMTIEQARAALEALVVEKTMTQQEAEDAGVKISDADTYDSFYLGSNWVKRLSFYSEIGKSLGGYVRRGLTRLYSSKFGLASEVKEDDERSRAKPMVRPRLDNIVREGLKEHRGDKDVTAQDFIDTFGFRGVEFGNWVNSAERQVNVNLAFDAFWDLADTLGVPAKAISLGGKLGMAFGSRGTGRHAAHYEPGNVVINLTKTKGDGTVAHEWGHALDYAIRSGAGSKGDLSVVPHPSGTGFALQWTDGEYVPAPQGSRNEGQPAQWDNEGNARRYGIPVHQNRGGKALGEKAVDDLKQALKQTYDVEYALQTIDRLLAGHSYVQGQKSLGPLQQAKNFIDREYWNHAGWGIKKTTDFKKEADKLGKDYWGNDNELWARAFEAFVFDKMEGSSPYLVTDWVADGTVTKEVGYKGRPYPTGQERGRFARLFEHLLEGVEWTADGPRIKEGYQQIAAAELKRLRDALAEARKTIDERYVQLKTGEAKSDGLFWYRFAGDRKRGAGKQPKGYFAFDDGAAMVGYPQALDLDDLTEFGLHPAGKDWQPGENVVYLNKDKTDGRDQQPDAVRGDGEEPLGDVSAEDGGASEEGGGVRSGPNQRAGTGEGADSGSGEPTGERPGERAGDGAGAVRPTSERGGTTDLGSGQDAVQPTGVNYQIVDADGVGVGSIERKFRENLAAIEVLKKVESENRLATPAEQKILVKYVGWGGMPQAFGYHHQEGWEARKKELKDLLTDEEYEAARASTTNAHYTAPVVIKSMWEAVQRLGFKGGRVLEPGVGVGHFFGLMPAEMAQHSKLTGVELDSLTARIAKQLYQRAAIVNKGYQETVYPEKFFDLVISNVPFSDADHPVDKRHNKERLNLHDYYFRKSLELTRPGGLVAFITSKGTMDKQDTKARKLFAERADFIGAIRLPQDAFQANAGTVVTTDIIFLRRKVEGEPYSPAHPWENTDEMDLPTGDGETIGMPVNEYFGTEAGGENLLGRLVVRRGRYGDSAEVALESDGRDLGKALAAAVERLPENVYLEGGHAAELERKALSIPAEGDVKDGGYTLKDGKLWRREGDLMTPVAEEKSAEKARGSIIRSSLKLRDSIRRMLRLRVDDAAEADVVAAKKAIEAEYRAFVKRHGYLNERDNVLAFAEDPDAALLLAVEKWNADTGKGERVEIDFQKRRPIEHTDSVQDALVVSLNEKGRVDWATITRLTGISEDLAKKELRGVVYDDPEQGWVTAEEYLAGNVREKLRVARAAAEVDSAFADNVKALEAAQPVDLPPSKINARPGAPWIPGEDIAAFMGELLNVRADRLNVNFLPDIGKWVISASSGRMRGGDAADQRELRNLSNRTEATVTWGTQDVPFVDMMDFALNGGFPKVYYPPDDDGKRMVNRKATEAANAKLQEIKDRFSRWVWEDPDRAARLARKYNDEMNNIRLREYKYPASKDQLDAHGNVRLPGMALGISLRPHQAAAVWRTVQSGNTYYAHEVGTGKTFTMTAAAMELKRLGLAKKPMLAVLNSTIGQIKAEFLRLYPGANILAMNISQSKDERKRQLARIALNDWDAVIVTHESFSRIPMSPAAISASFQAELDNLTNSILAAKQDRMNARVVKELEKSKKALENRMKAMLAKREKDDVLSFEELGVDQIFIDEAQEFKNLMFATRMGRQMRGLNPEGSGRAFDLFMKTNWLNDTLGRGVVLSSGTSISNSVGELFSVSRYLQPAELKKRGIQTFDPWANSFGDIGQVAEYLPEGGGYQMVTKFNRFVNIPELMQMVYTVMDTVTADKAGLKRPKIKDGKPTAVLVEQNEGVTALMKSLEARAKAIRSNPKGALPDNMLVVVSDGRKGAMDMRLVDDAAPDYEQTKTNAAVERILTIYKREAEKKGTQLVFADLGTPGDGFSVYEDLKKKLVKRGIPADQIAFVHDAKNDRERKAMFAKVNAGKIRVFIGSTKKAGTGVNVQERVAAIHNLDTHWNLANLIQRLGRGQRQGNIYDEIEVFNYATEGTVDAFMWDKVQAKGRFIDQVMSGDVSLREAEDISQETMSAAEMVAVASGDPLIAEKVELESAVQKLSLQAAAFDDTMMTVRRDLAAIPQKIRANAARAAAADKAAAELEKVNAVQIGEKNFKLADDKTREEMNKLIVTALEQNRKRVEDEVAKADALDKAGKKAQAKKMRDDIKTSSTVGAVVGEGVSMPLNVRAGFGDWVEIRTSAGDRDWGGDTTIGRGLSNVARSFKSEAEGERAEIKRLEGELPKLREAASRKFGRQEELDKKRARLAEVERILTSRDAKEGVAEDTPDIPANFRFVTQGSVVSYVTDFEDLPDDTFPELGAHRFFVHAVPNQSPPNYKSWRITHVASGRYAVSGESREEAIQKFRDIIERDLERVTTTLDKAEAITDADKEEALAAQRKAKASRGGAQPARGLTPEQVRARLIEAFGPGIDKLIQDDVLHIVRTAAELPESVRSHAQKLDVKAARKLPDVEAWYDPTANNGTGAVYMLASGLRDARVVPVLLHELGEHYGLRTMLGADGYAALHREVRALHARGTSPAVEDAWRHVRENYPSLTETSTDFVSEVIARVGETADGRRLPFFRRLLTAIREFLVKLGLRLDMVRNISDEDLRLLVAASAREAIRKAGRPMSLGGGIQQSAKPGVFYSELQRKLADLKRGSGTANEWKSAIAALPGVKKDEIEWSGILDWLTTVDEAVREGLVPETYPQGKISKDTVLAFLADNGVRVEEKVMGGEGGTNEADSLQVRLDALGYDVEYDMDGFLNSITRRADKVEFMYFNEGIGGEVGYADDSGTMLPPEANRLALALGRAREDLVDERWGGRNDTGTRYSQYTLPGGEHYRELLLTLPLTRGGPEAEAVARESLEAARQRGGRGGALFQSTHFDAPNILAHVRFDERTDAEGKRVLFIEEIQSDWAQKGKREGFAKSTEGWTAKQLRSDADGGFNHWQVNDASGNEVTKIVGGGTPEGAIRKAAEGIPAAPFVGKTEAWVSLALKRMIAWAAENDFDRVAWTTGDQQAKRYDLSRHVDEISVVFRQLDEMYDVRASKNGRPVIEKAVKNEDQLADLIGKDLAARAVREIDTEADDIRERTAVFKGLDLRLGGEGMRAFYDRIVPNVANDVLKKLGGGRVDTVRFGKTVGEDLDRKEIEDSAVAYIMRQTTPEEFLRDSGLEGLVTEKEIESAIGGYSAQEYPSGIRNAARIFAKDMLHKFAGQKRMKQPGFDITPELRERALKGLPLFSRRAADPSLRFMPWPKDGDKVISTSVLATAMREHKDYAAAKAGDGQAASRLVQDLFRPAKLREIRQTMGADVYFVPVISKEATGHNQIPVALAEWAAFALNTNTVEAVYQANQPHHTGAKAMERLIARPSFAGPVEAGRRYVLVDDVTTMGGTLAELANHIQQQGGIVAGAVTIVNASRSATMMPSKGQVRDIERRYGDEVRELFGIEPAALTEAEARYILGFRDAQSLRDRAASAQRETDARLHARGIRQEGQAEPGLMASRGGADDVYFGPLQVKEYAGRDGNSSHLTRKETGLVPVDAISGLRGERGEERGAHRNRQGADWESFKDDIRKNGIREPILIVKDWGKRATVYEGNHRIDAAVELGLEEIPAEIRYFGNAQKQGLVLPASAYERAPMASRGGADDTKQVDDGFGNSAIEPFTVEGREKIADRAKDWMASQLQTSRTFNWWHRTVGTQYHKATVSAPFRRAFKEGQDFLTDVNYFSMRAEEEAPDVLLRIEGLKDIPKRPPAKADIEATARALFEGTLDGGPSPIDGKVFTDAELIQRGLTDKQISLYRQVRSAVDHSVRTLAKSVIARLVRTHDIKVDRAMSLEDITAQATEALNEKRAELQLRLEEIGDDTATRHKITKQQDTLEQAAKMVEKTAKRAEDLIAAGYMPLMRFGRYSVNVFEEDADGKPVELFFSLFETEAAANRAAEALRTEYPNAIVEQGIMSRDAYRIFKGISPDTIELFAEVAGMDEHPLMQQYIQLAVAERSALKRLLQRKGTPGFSWDIPRVLAQFVTSNSRAAAGNYHHANMLEAVDDIPAHQGDVKDEAVRLYEYLTNPQEEVAGLRGYLFFHFMGGSIATALVNMTQPVMMTGPWLAQHTNPADAAAQLARAMAEAARTKAPEDAAGKAMHKAIEEGIVAPHEIYQLMAEARGGLGRSVALRQITRAWGGLFSLAEAWNRKTTFLAAYRIAEKRGLGDPYAFAVKAVIETQGLYNRGNRPNWARGALGATIFTFKQFSIAYLEFVKRLPRKQQLMALAILMLASGLQGLPFADDLDDLVDTIGQWMGFATNSKSWKRQVAEAVLGEGAGDFVLHGVSAFPGFPLDVQLRLGLGNLIPGTSLAKPSEGRDKGREFAEVFGPAGGLARSAFDVAEKAFAGDFEGAGKVGLPTALRNAYMALEMWQTGEYRDTRGRRVVDTNALDGFVKAVGFNPAVVARASRKITEVRTDIELQRQTEASIADAWARAIVNRDESGIAAAKERLRDWNSTNPELRVVIRHDQLMRRVREARKTRAERFARTAAPEIRGRVVKELQE